ncbi:MAG: hypothetical protein RIG68_16085 [Imperialibacter sp.]|jgi:hypothetical protein|uniref:hypothetical protein n=1 Tax=Imperialibacter sp. TaxID=2038411 RepID=UPI0032F05F54
MNLSDDKLTTLQLELLKVYSFNPSPKEMEELKLFLGKFFADRFTQKVELAAKENGITSKDLDNWLEEDGQ